MIVVAAVAAAVIVVAVVYLIVTIMSMEMSTNNSTSTISATHSNSILMLFQHGNTEKQIQHRISYHEDHGTQHKRLSRDCHHLVYTCCWEIRNPNNPI